MTPTCDPDGALHNIVVAPGLLCCHQSISAEGQVLIVAGNQVPGDGAAEQESATDRQQG